MSKGSLFWANASGKLGETVFYRAKGEQRNRTYVAKIKNPKTLLQMSNRLAMLNLVTFYKLMKGLLDSSFTTKKEKESDYNAFVRSSKNANTCAISKLMAQQASVAPENFAISRGDLTIDTSLSTTLKASAEFNLFKQAIAGSSVGEDFQSTAIQTSNQLYNVLRGNQNPLNLPDKFNLIIAFARNVDEGFAVSAFALSASSDLAGRDVAYPRWTKIAGDAKGYFMESLPVIYTGTAPDLVVTGVKAAIPLEGGEGDSELPNAVAIAISYKDANGLHVTNSNYHNLEDSEGVSPFEEYQPGGDVWEQVLNDYGYNANSALVQ